MRTANVRIGQLWYLAARSRALAIDARRYEHELVELITGREPTTDAGIAQQRADGWVARAR
jgi:hypothetical protein